MRITAALAIITVLGCGAAFATDWGSTSHSLAGTPIWCVEDCTLCRMPRPTTEFRGPCAQGEVARLERYVTINQ